MAKNIEKTAEIQGISIESAAYPQALRKLEDAPPVLYVKGNPDCLNLPAVAVVGTRTPTPEGLETARKMGNMFAELGFVVVSGLARGCDTAAHEGCLEAGGRTIAVLAHGLDLLYPPENSKLVNQIRNSKGCIISEYAPGTSPQAALFVRRNRLITALGKLTIAIEPKERSGTAHALQYTKIQKNSSYEW